MAKKKYKLIVSQSALVDLAGRLSGEKIIGVDTESNSMYAYREEVCLIQISTPKDNFIIDPFEIDDFSCLGPVFSSEKIEKIFHAGEYDVLCLSRDYGFEFNKLFDTMIAAKILGEKKIGLGDIIENEFNIKVPKKYQKADWGRRPLPEEMLGYAMMDTKFLIPLRDKYKKELIKEGHMELAQEEFRDLARPLEIEPVTPESTFLKMIRSRELSKKQKSVLWQLIQIRDREAKKRDKPLFKVLSDRLLLKVASELPRTKKALSGIKGMSPFNMSKFADKFLKIISSTRALYPKPAPRKKGGWEYLKRLDKITKWRTKEGKKRGLSSEFVLPRHLMETIARKNPRTLKAVKDAMGRFPYRIKLYADSIKDLF